jgi:hypothetical protein
MDGFMVQGGGMFMVGFAVWVYMYMYNLFILRCLVSSFSW